MRVPGEAEEEPEVQVTMVRGGEGPLGPCVSLVRSEVLTVLGTTTLVYAWRGLSAIYSPLLHIPVVGQCVCVYTHKKSIRQWNQKVSYQVQKFEIIADFSLYAF